MFGNDFDGVEVELLHLLYQFHSKFIKSGLNKQSFVQILDFIRWFLFGYKNQQIFYNNNNNNKTPCFYLFWKILCCCWFSWLLVIYAISFKLWQNKILFIGQRCGRPSSFGFWRDLESYSRQKQNKNSNWTEIHSNTRFVNAALNI